MGLQQRHRYRTPQRYIEENFFVLAPRAEGKERDIQGKRSWLVGAFVFLQISTGNELSFNIEILVLVFKILGLMNEGL